MTEIKEQFYSGYPEGNAPGQKSTESDSFLSNASQLKEEDSKQKEGKSGDDKAILIKLTSQKVVQKKDKEEKQEENEQQLDPSYVKDINDSLKQQKDIPSQMSIEEDQKQEDQKQEDQKEEDNDLNESNPPYCEELVFGNNYQNPNPNIKIPIQKWDINIDDYENPNLNDDEVLNLEEIQSFNTNGPLYHQLWGEEGMDLDEPFETRRDFEYYDDIFYASTSPWTEDNDR